MAKNMFMAGDPGMNMFYMEDEMKIREMLD